MEQCYAVANSSNRKIGLNLGATYRPIPDTCPKTCILCNNGCYAQKGFSIFWANKARNSVADFDIFKKTKSKLVRLNVSGDFFKNDNLDPTALDEVIGFFSNNPDIMAWFYTHRIEDYINSGYCLTAFPINLKVVASVDTEEQRQISKKNGFKYSIVKKHEHLIENEVYCPIDIFRHKNPNKKWKDISLTCEKCRLCFSSDKDIVFMKME